MTPGEKRYLSKYECMWCEQRLSRDWCAAIWEKCSEEDMERRRKRCLMGYKPRKGESNAAPQKAL